MPLFIFDFESADISSYTVVYYWYLSELVDLSTADPSHESFKIRRKMP